MGAPPFATLVFGVADAVPAEALARQLDGLQALARAVAPPATGRGARVIQRDLLRVRPVAGGLALSLGGVQLALDLGLGASPGELGGRMMAVLAAIAARDSERLLSLVPDDAARRRALAAARKLAPRAGDTWSVQLEAPGHAAVVLAADLGASLVHAPTPPGTAVRMTVTGELAGVDFTAERLTLRSGPGGRTLAGRYAQALEVKLLKARRKHIHLTGEFALDELGEPRAIRLALDFSIVDLSPLTLERIETEAATIVFEPPLVLTPVLDAATGQLYEAEDERLELRASAATRDDLVAALHAEVGRRWAAYGRTGLAGYEAVVARLWRRRLRVADSADAFA